MISGQKSMELKYGCDDKQQRFVFFPKPFILPRFCLYQHLSWKPHSDGNEIGVAETLGVVEHGDEYRGDVEDSNILDVLASALAVRSAIDENRVRI